MIPNNTSPPIFETAAGIANFVERSIALPPERPPSPLGGGLLPGIGRQHLLLQAEPGVKPRLRCREKFVVAHLGIGDIGVAARFGDNNNIVGKNKAFAIIRVQPKA